jgi:hypothetical protein
MIPSWVSRYPDSPDWAARRDGFKRAAALAKMGERRKILERDQRDLRK